MRLNNKVLLTLGVTWVIFFAISYVAAEQYLLKSFLEVERSQIKTNINRVKQALDQVSYALSTFTVDWAHWNDAYEYIEGANPQFVPNNVDYATLINSNINILIYMNIRGEILLGVPFDIEARKQIAFPIGLDKYIYPGSLLEQQRDMHTSTRGLIALPGGLMLIAAAGTSYTDLSKPINGTTIAARFFSKQLLQKLADAVSLSLMLYTVNNIDKDITLVTIFQNTQNSIDGEYIVLRNDKVAYGYTVLYDILKKPIGMLRVTVPRVIYATGKQAIHFYLGVYLVAGIILSVIIWFLLRLLILKRVEYLNRQIKEISGKKDYQRHIKVEKNDELSSLARQFNLLMETIYVSHEQLRQQVQEITQSEKQLEATNTKLILEIHERKQMQQKVEALHKKLILAARRAGMADIASGVLHNVGNILNNVTTSVGMTKEMVDSSRVNKLNDLAKLLDDNKANLVDFLTNDPRGAKILDYIGLLANALIEENKHLREEVHSLDRYIGHIKEVVTMQQSMTSVIGMVENLKIADVIDDALMLNKAISENKNIKIITDIQFKENVSLDRVKLLHVLVNLIKNSIEALLLSQMQDKHILIRALKSERGNFTIEVSDNGEGIMPENLTKIFNYGFTTKANGNGIGLHTSATFIQEMGGKLYAKSDGVGHGATFVVELPIHLADEHQTTPQDYLKDEF
jgi:sensor domain CHASE-containing protein